MGPKVSGIDDCAFGCVDYEAIGSGNRMVNVNGLCHQMVNLYFASCSERFIGMLSEISGASFFH